MIKRIQMKKQIGIIGLGYLGSKLAHKLLSQYEVIGTTRTSETSLPIQHLHLNLETSSDINQHKTLWNSDVIVIAIPPSQFSNYADSIKRVFDNLQKSQTKVIFISSISAFAKDQGDINELTQPEGKTSIIEAENIVLNNNGFILRLGGIVGPGRTPWQYVSGKDYEYDEYLHLVHVNDIIKSITWLIEKNTDSRVFNIVNSQRVLKSQFYPNKCDIPPTYGPLLNNAKKIDNSLSKKIMGIEYQDL